MTFRRMKHKWLFLLLLAPLLLALLLLLTMGSSGEQESAAAPISPFYQEDAPFTVLTRQGGTYEYLGAPTDTEAAAEHAARTIRFAGELEDMGIAFAYFQAPHKTSRARASLPGGLELGNHAAADTFLAALDEAGIAAFDLRDVIEPMPVEESFFRTDHHWTPAAGYRAFQWAAPMLTERYGFTFPQQALDISGWDIEVFENAFRGAQGIAAGETRLDDIAMWTPRFDTDFSYSAPNHGVHREGTFDQTLLFAERIGSEEAIGSNPYTLWSGGDYTMGRIDNRLHDSGLTVFVLRDSFGCTFTPFLALGADETVTFDLRNYEHPEDIMEYITWLKPDVVLMFYTTSSTQNPELFPDV